jgi:hypothetical protein
MSQDDKAEEVMKSADKKIKGFSFFDRSSKWEEAADMYTKAANLFKMSKKCMYFSFHEPPCSSSHPPHERMSWVPHFDSISTTGDRSGEAYTKAAECHLKLQSKHEAATNYIAAANCYKKSNVAGNLPSFIQFIYSLTSSHPPSSSFITSPTSPKLSSLASRLTSLSPHLSHVFNPHIPPCHSRHALSPRRPHLSSSLLFPHSFTYISWDI